VAAIEEELRVTVYCLVKMRVALVKVAGLGRVSREKSQAFFYLL